jgi:hypothetical protein
MVRVNGKKKSEKGGEKAARMSPTPYALSYYAWLTCSKSVRERRREMKREKERKREEKKEGRGREERGPSSTAERGM